MGLLKSNNNTISNREFNAFTNDVSSILLHVPPWIYSPPMAPLNSSKDTVFPLESIAADATVFSNVSGVCFSVSCGHVSDQMSASFIELNLGYIGKQMPCDIYIYNT